MVDKLLQRKNGKTQQYTPVTQSAGAADAGKIPALNSSGKLDPTTMPDGIGAATRLAPATEALTAGAFVNEYANSGALAVRLADNSNNRPATGFVKSGFTNGQSATIWPLDSTNDQLSSLTIGTDYYLGTAGGVLATPLDATDTAQAGKIDQRLGRARSATELVTDDYDYVVL
ncbi:hypothetical protein [Pseudomonas oryzihabitans]|uniref:Uncharacterized protein n=1 Tax=Pseudomonas oryzihabitans TaxID=47885 RepID=A0A2Z5ABL7_9PSED|nr:hypothetical protein [Pseudomonas oryzihabitans]AXA66761.1 hypothetical protein CE139_13340 [Pseudomonas oryzihabitans]